MVARPAHARAAARAGALRARRAHRLRVAPAACTATARGARVDETRAVAPGARRARSGASTPRRGALLRPRDAARASACCASPASTRPTAPAATRASACARHAGARGRGRRLHEPHPRRRPGARLRRGAVARRGRSASYNASDDSELKMGDYFDLAADLYGLPRPPRVARHAARGAAAAGAPELHGRIAPAGQHAAEERVAPAPAPPDRGERAAAPERAQGASDAPVLAAACARSSWQRCASAWCNCRWR